ncbi:MAG: PIN domain nuclease [Clostridiales Family XIII bacterium]|jgi:uncharacterized protein YacL|nr:PIN domain nuclease [Clostridiales Family XIII bacterium]
MIKNFIRGGITFLGFWIGFGIFTLARGLLVGVPKERLDLFAVISGIVIAIIFFLLTPVLIKLSSRIAGNIDKETRHLSAVDFITGVAGLIIGLVIAMLISNPITAFIPFISLNPTAAVVVTVAIYIILAWLGIVIGSRKGRDLVNMVLNSRRELRRDIAEGAAAVRGAAGPTARELREAKRQERYSTPKIFDTSVIIDGRIADILKAGFLEGRIVIPDFVLVELRHIADSSDGLKRNRGRRGLDILNKIQEDFGVDIYATASDKNLEDVPEVDVKLLKLAQSMKGKLVTNDYNLNKVATIQNIPVLNINDLANRLKPVVLPGEEMTLYLVKEGKERGQAVAYLDDGTMIVVEDGKGQIGNTVDVVVTSVLQTAAGRMIFARLG